MNTATHHPLAQSLLDIAHGMNATANQATLRKAAELIDRMTNAEAQPGAVLRELVALKDLQERLLSLHEMGHGTDYGDFHKRNREAWAEASAFAASGQCRSDGRCQYAIDHGAEGMGHCPQGKCCMLLPEPAYKHIDGDTNDADLLWAEIHHLRVALQGPAGFATWQDAATDERIRRIKAERLLTTPDRAANSLAAPASDDSVNQAERPGNSPEAVDVVPQREHVASADCWCEPTAEYVDPATGVRILVHKEIQ